MREAQSLVLREKKVIRKNGLRKTQAHQPALHVWRMCVYTIGYSEVCVCVCVPSTWRAEAVRALCVRGQSGLFSKFQNIQGYIEKPCL